MRVVIIGTYSMDRIVMKNKEERDLASNSKSEDAVVKLWTLLHRVHDALVLCEDSIFSEYRITMEKFTLLAAVRAWGGSLQPSKLAGILGRSPNSVSMLVDRMVKAGLVKRTRDRKDRRVVKVSLTGKGEDALKPAEPAGWEFIERILLVLSYEEKDALINLLEKVKQELVVYLNPGLDRAEVMKRNRITERDFYAHVTKTLPPSCPEGKHQVARRRKAR
jgi:DNA-binding MarR family transcriptional regulator